MQIKIFDDLRQELENTEADWSTCHSKARDPNELYAEKKKVWEAEQAKLNQSEESGGGLFGGLFGSKP